MTKTQTEVVTKLTTWLIDYISIRNYCTKVVKRNKSAMKKHDDELAKAYQNELKACQYYFNKVVMIKRNLVLFESELFRGNIDRFQAKRELLKLFEDILNSDAIKFHAGYFYEILNNYGYRGSDVPLYDLFIEIINNDKLMTSMAKNRNEEAAPKILEMVESFKQYLNYRGEFDYSDSVAYGFTLAKYESNPNFDVDNVSNKLYLILDRLNNAK